MPDASGWSVLEKLKDDPQTAGIPVLVVTIVEDQRMVFALGASDYLPKPFDRGQLIDRVHRLLPNLQGKRVLVVDDEPQARLLLSRSLQDEGAEVREVASGDEGMTAVSQMKPDLVLLDLMMPGMSGFEMVARLRATPAGADVPIMIVSAKELTQEDMATLNGHVQRFISKGTVDPVGLVAAVRQVIGNRSVQRHAA
jgi:CheY-like chemotaxis protein